MYYHYKIASNTLYETGYKLVAKYKHYVDEVLITKITPVPKNTLPSTYLYF